MTKKVRIARLSFLLAVFVAVVAVVLAGKVPWGVRYRAAAPDSHAALTNGLDIVEAARRQIGVTVQYDPSYQRIAYPGGDVPKERGVCSDVVVRALREARGLDLQRLVHEDMAAHFLLYPALVRWQQLGPDANIDHRRVLNLRRFFERQGWALVVDEEATDNYLPGDLVTCLVSDGVPHIMVVSDRKSDKGVPLAIHNIGGGTREDDLLFYFPITGHYRLRDGVPPPDRPDGADGGTSCEGQGASPDAPQSHSRSLSCAEGGSSHAEARRW